MRTRLKYKNVGDRNRVKRIMSFKICLLVVLREQNRGRDAGKAARRSAL